MARFTTLYSGSSGNAGIIEENGKFLMVDIGLSCKATLAALAKINLEPENLLGILITHEHSDHISGLNVFLKRYPRPVFSSLATIAALCEMNALPIETELIAIDRRSEELAGFNIYGFPTSHDSAGCCGFYVTTPQQATLAIATDLGIISEENFKHFMQANLVALESNYDSKMLKTGPYPAYLKRRIAGERGHLSNFEAALATVSLVENGCRRIAYCHLSQENNHPTLVQQEVEKAFFAHGCKIPAECRIQIQKRHEPSEWMDF